MKTDARVRYTLMRIQTVFFELLEKKPMSKITVKEICDLAEINRATFYHHYQDVYDLLEQQENIVIGRLRDYICEKEGDGILLSLLQAMQQKETHHQIFRMAAEDPNFSDRVAETFVAMYLPQFQPRFAGYPPHQQQQIMQFFTSGCSGVIALWVKGGMAQPAQDVAAFLGQLTSGFLESL